MTVAEVDLLFVFCFSHNTQPRLSNKSRSRVFSWVRSCCVNATLIFYSWFEQPVVSQYMTGKAMIFGWISSDSVVPPHRVTGICLFVQWRRISIAIVNLSLTECSNPSGTGKLTLVFRIDKVQTVDCLFSGRWWYKTKKHKGGYLCSATPTNLNVFCFLRNWNKHHT